MSPCKCCSGPRVGVWREFCCELVDSVWYTVLIVAVLLLNTVCIGLNTSQLLTATSGWYLSLVNQLFLAVYITELCLLLLARGLHYFRSYWNIFDSVLVVCGCVEVVVSSVTSAGVLVSVLRGCRALRMVRIIRFVSRLQDILRTLLESIPALGGIVLLISLVLYIFAVIGRGLYGDVDPDRFGNLLVTGYTLFQLITLDDWFLVYTHTSAHLLLYLTLFILCETLLFVNLFIAVIVDNQTRAHSTLRRGAPARSSGEVSHSEPPQSSDRGYVQLLNTLHHQLGVCHTQHSTLDQLVDLTHPTAV